MCPKHIREDFFCQFFGKNMKKLLTFVAVFALATTALTIPQKAEANSARPSAALISPFDNDKQVVDNRAQILKGFLESYDSPLAPHAQTFIDEADKNGLDWKLVPAIAGVESWFGQRIPYNSYNGWGYGVYGNNVRNFTSWDDGIHVVSTALREDYMDRWGATNVAEIGSHYAADPKWAYKVQHFIDLIEEYEEKENKKTLSLSL